MKLSRDDIEVRLSAADRKGLFEALDVDFERGKAGQNGWINGLYLPEAIRKDKHPSCCYNLETGAVKDHGSDYSADLWQFIQDVRRCTFSEALKWAATIVGSYKVGSGKKWNPFNDGKCVATYSYEDEACREICQVLRFEVNEGHPAYPDKTFLQRHYDPSHQKSQKDGCVWQAAKKHVPFRLPQLLKAAGTGQVIFIVEGEKDVLTLESEGLVATCNAGGAGKWQTSFADYFGNESIVVILPDNDVAGRDHAQAVAQSLYGRVKALHILDLPELPEKGDVADWINAGHTAKELKELVKKCSVWKPVSNDSQSTQDVGEEIGVLVSEIEREKVKWLWPGRLALGKLTILDGDPGLGKSTLYCDIAARITTGCAWPEDTDGNSSSLYLDAKDAGNVVIVTCEDGIADTIRPRLEEAGADLTRCRVVQTISDKDKNGERFDRVPAFPNDVPFIEKAVIQSRATLLVIDPLFAHLDGNINSYRDQDVRRALTPIVHMAERLNVAVLVIRHLNKVSGGSALYRGGGSIGIIGQARVGLLLGIDPGDDEALVLATTKSNIAIHPSSLSLRIVSSVNDKDVGIIHWQGNSPFHAQDLLVAPNGKKRSVIDDAAQWLREQLNDGELHRAKEMWALSDEAGFSEKTMRRALKDAGVNVEQIPKKPGGLWFWSLFTNNEDLITDDSSIEENHDAVDMPVGQISFLDHLEEEEGANADISVLNALKNVDLLSDSQTANVTDTFSRGHLVESAGDGATPGQCSDHSLLETSVAIEPGTIVRLLDGRTGTATPTIENGKIGVYLFDDPRTVFIEPEKLSVLF